MRRDQGPLVRAEHLRELRVLGDGTFGEVKLVLDVRTKALYARKSLHKAQVIELRQEEAIVREKRVLAECDHPFLLRLIGTFTDATHLHMLLEYVCGGELFDLLREYESFTEPTTAFYGGCIASALAYLHERAWVYRDLKPENILLDERGYLKIVDFGFAKKLLAADRTWTLCGTPEYIAPEIISNKGHATPVDWWALGVLLYEMLDGRPPFDASDPMEIYRLILHERVEPPRTFSAVAKALTTALLVKEPAARLGALADGSAGVFGHPFFAEVDWEALLRRELKPPTTPDVVSVLTKAPLSGGGGGGGGGKGGNGNYDEMLACIPEAQLAFVKGF